MPLIMPDADAKASLGQWIRFNNQIRRESVTQGDLSDKILTLIPSIHWFYLTARIADFSRGLEYQAILLLDKIARIVGSEDHRM